MAAGLRNSTGAVEKLPFAASGVPVSAVPSQHSAQDCQVRHSFVLNKEEKKARREHHLRLAEDNGLVTGRKPVSLSQAKCKI